MIPLSKFFTFIHQDNTAEGREYSGKWPFLTAGMLLTGLAQAITKAVTGLASAAFRVIGIGFA